MQSVVCYLFTGMSVIQRSLEKQARAGKIGEDEVAAAVGRIETAVSLEVRVRRQD